MGTNEFSEEYGYNQDVDSSGWKQPVGAGPAPAPVKQTESGMKRTVTKDPYDTDNPNPHVKRNFGRS